MKNKSIISILLFALGLSVSFSSCEDMLTADSDRNVYQTGQDTLYSYWGIMKSMQSIAERYVILGESRGDLISPSAYAIDSINDIATFKNPVDKSCRYLNVKDYYSVINNCNCYLAWADTSLIVLGNQKMMIKEYAQVMAIRAWTYMQLVNTYGEVPFYTEPLTSLSFVDNFDFSQAANRISHTNIADKLVGQLIPLADVAYPSYGSYETGGGVSVASKLCFLPLRVVIADLYLMQSNYEQAAQYYYDYLKKNSYVLPSGYSSSVGVMTITTNGVETKEYSYNSSMGMFTQTTGASTATETITVIPSAANPLYGQMLPGICELYGYNVSTSVSSDSSNEDDATGEQSSSVSVSRNYKKQLEPSEGFLSIANSNFYFINNDEKPELNEYIPGDARQGYTQEYSGGTDLGKIRFITKPAPYGSFSYTFPVLYRKALIWLRFAEAINRAGFPSYAYAILKDGLCDDYIPLAPEMKTVELTDPETGDVLTDEEGNPLTEEVEVYDPLNKTCYYITQSERKEADSKPYLDFSTTEFTKGEASDPTNIGVHSRGGGQMEGRKNELYDYDVQIAFKFKENGVSDRNSLPTKADTIAAVEELIVDELALETCFEGNRMPDLIRFAKHKNEAGEDGNGWLADKIGFRTFKLDTKRCQSALNEAEAQATDEEKAEDATLGERAYIYDAIKQKNEFRQSNSEYMQMREQLKDQHKWFLSLPSYK